MKDDFDMECGRAPSPAAPEETPRNIVAVGDVSGWGDAAERPAQSDSVIFAGFNEVNGGLMSLLKPAIILSPLVALDFDCTDLALKLDAMGFSGSYIAVADLPRPEMVEQEIRSLCTDLDFGIVAPGDLGLTL
ncbi:MAG: hypothetical protein AAF771_06445 [Pseudomonadota bacterium]